ncbi:copper amine oxidase [Phaeosphaeriaceae sp. PMI808]|nr:copper amine oxidase [Phaeosphaeriaceae sp. PMI808]
MKYPSSSLVLLSLSLSCGIVEAIAKAPWVEQYARTRGRKHLGSTIAKRQNITIEPQDCIISDALATKSPKQNIWGSLTGPEASGVVSWLFAQKELNLTVAENATNWDNTIVTVELLTPNKTDALVYMDGSNTQPPTRYARAIIDVRATETPYFQEIRVGPLPLMNGTAKWDVLDHHWTRKTGGRVRNLVPEVSIMQTAWLNHVGAAVADITLDLWNMSMAGLKNDTLVTWGIDPPFEEDGRFLRWDQFWSMPTSTFDVTSNMQMGLFFLSDVTGRDISKWSVEGWYYNGIFYNTTEEFRTDYWGGKVEKLLGNVDGEWGHTDQRGPILAHDTKAPPVMVAPQGARFSIDHANKYVEWMGWSFYLGFKHDTGLVFHDISYKGQRILYELGMQEALAHYAANSAYLDSLYGFGPFAFELLKGYDCPSYATYINSSFYVTETTHTHLNSICLFEYDSDHPISRHSTANYVAATKNIYFAVRSVSTIGNYDYMSTYTFYLDGSMGIEVRASGYIQSAFYAKNEDYGFKIHDQLSGSLHDHVINFKADFDILGTSNSVQLIDQVPIKTTYPWSRGKEYSTMRMERKFLENEDEGRFNWQTSRPQEVLIVNEDKKNKYGEFRAFRVAPYTGTAHLTIENSSILLNSARWADKDLMFSVAKDTEPRSHNIFNTMDKANPPVNFDKFFDGESLRKQDLVLWFNLGMHHIPHTGDLPMTVYTTAHTGVHFSPVNYHEGNPSVETVNMVRIDYKNGVTSSVTSFLASNTTCEVDYKPHFVDLWKYKGDVVVRKYPYDPSNPFYFTTLKVPI